VKRTLSKRKRENLYIGIEEFDFHRPVSDLALLPDQLVETMLSNFPCAASICVNAMIDTRSGSIQRNFEPNRPPVRCRAKNQMQVASMKAEHNFA
jgi:hypothetical protein